MNDLTMFRGDSRTLSIVATNADGTAYDLTGATLWFTARRRVDDADDDAVIAKRTGSGITVISAVGGLASVALEATDTASLEDELVLLWDLQAKDAAGAVATMAKGSLRVRADITRATI